jgi:hypothetical protein
LEIRDEEEIFFSSLSPVILISVVATWHRTLIREAVNLSSDSASANAGKKAKKVPAHTSAPSPSEADLRLTRGFFQFFA